MTATAILPLPASLAERPEAMLTPVAGTSPLIRVVSALSDVASVVVAAAAALAVPVRELLAAEGFSDVPTLTAETPGGRAQCVTAALAAIRPGTPILVHDIGWPLVDAATARRVLAALRGGAAVVAPSRPVTDSIKTVDQDSVVTATLDRAELQVLQYPRGFQAEVLTRAVAAAQNGRADELDAALRTGARIALVDGDAGALGVELPRDTDFLTAVIEDRRDDSSR
ncbi:2-C-methyl-D-erythritol 4-phosphate cytidylyltransferase [Mycolicibacterium rufum]|uniref:2-C-methyl-D-erythritol 4-phosphate cytidylyltransferase n=1 Tax=Mycolicibacterium rufum TaxID=318424 RepID=A0A9X3BF49_9MYCO|nr:2-C-methyl-D-erythritol 4-phosphate cytidylyltransferase [Mycolicibacterium rufum]KGI69112.1 hypothetical protein EU78_18630 [Mycolicibacterium rufum]MCV7069999.1 2-C-methyl-D-erythritol 4-phosphate cytidylyltransferase [Mycolicibacterium rufum]ULP35297.1 2-C-methyl-D-erythritol 4-phosphate cytidylyltransferase [Mycolicibacterium rufum]